MLDHCSWSLLALPLKSECARYDGVIEHLTMRLRLFLNPKRRDHLPDMTPKAWAMMPKILSHLTKESGLPPNPLVLLSRTLQEATA